MKLTSEQGKSLVYGDLEGWETVSERIEDVSRWSVNHSGIFKHIETNKFYKTYWSVGATEIQDERPFDHYPPELVEVQQVEKTILIWEEKK